MVRSIRWRTWLALPALVLLVMAAAVGCGADDDDDDDDEPTVVPTGSTVQAGTATVGTSGTASPAVGTAATVAGAATGTAPADGSGTGTADDEEDALAVTLTDSAIEPPTLTANAGEITFEITNNGTSVHTLALDIDDDPVSSPDVAPGETETWTITLDTTGDHTLYSLAEGEPEPGLEATLTIVP